MGSWTLVEAPFGWMDGWMDSVEVSNSDERRGAEGVGALPVWWWARARWTLWWWMLRGILDGHLG